MVERILITGAEGMLGKELIVRLLDEGYEVIATDLADLDITDQAACKRYVRESSADIIINSAAYTIVDKAEEEPKKAMAVNGSGPGYLAEAANQTDAFLVHYSTDYIFDGAKKSPYDESDEPSPLSSYGRSKLEGEKRIQAAQTRHLIIRTEWLFGSYGNNFVRSIRNAASRLPRLEVVNDQYGSPTYAVDLAEATVILLRAKSEGIVNFTNSGTTTWFDFAKLILKELSLGTEVQPITSDQLNRPASRPLNSRLDLAKYIGISGTQPPHFEDALRRYLKSEEMRKG
jgi:dTDP-4-dehydrorhamnose reductase